jgi:hypothetical protein
MTNPNDANLKRAASGRTAGYVPWIIGGVVAVAAIAGIFMWVSADQSTTTASGPAGDRPAAGAATSPPAGSGTTGAGSAAGSGTTSGSQTTSPPPASR